MVIPYSMVLRIWKFQEKLYRKSKYTFLLTFSKSLVFYDIMWENIVQPDRTQMTIWRMRSACWIQKARDTHSEYVTIIAFPLQLWLHESASVLWYTHIVMIYAHCMSCFYSYFFYFFFQFVRKVFSISLVLFLPTSLTSRCFLLTPSRCTRL